MNDQNNQGFQQKQQQGGKNDLMQQSKTTKLMDIPFSLPQRYVPQKLIGSGSYGNVALVMDSKTNQKMAVKKLHALEDIIDGKRILREIRIIRLLQHPNIIQLRNVLYDNKDESNPFFGTIYLVFDYYPSDLSRVIRKNNDEISDDHIQYIMYQLFCGLKYMHSAQFLHRDIKPGNILVSQDCDVVYCDYGFARKMDTQLEQDNTMTEYVVTSSSIFQLQIQGYYRAPEVMLSSQNYSYPVDIWSLGCTFAELLNEGKILFKGKSYIQMIQMIFDALGKPDDNSLAEFITNVNAKQYVDGLPNKPVQSIKETIKHKNQQALDLLDKMLVINPNRRMTCAQALEHSYFSDIRNLQNEKTFEGETDFEFENDDKITFDQIKDLILQEINRFRQINKEPLIIIPDELKRINGLVAKQKQIKKSNQAQTKK